MMRVMQGWPLTLNRIIEHAARWHGDREVVSWRPDGSLDRGVLSTDGVRRISQQPTNVRYWHLADIPPALRARHRG